MKRIKTIIRKEWAEVFRNRMVLFTIIFLPLIFTALPLIILGTTTNAGVSSMGSDMPAQFAQLCGKTLSGGACFQKFILNQFMFLFLMMPLIIPINIAAYSIVGEKTTRSLEPLLATPISTTELLGGKNLAAVIPAVAATLVSYMLYMIGAFIIVRSPTLLKEFLDPLWLIAVVIVGPLLAVMSVNFCIIVSSRVNEPRAAEQISAVVILPLLILFMGQAFGLFFVNKLIILIIALALFLLDVLLLYLAVRLFQRETILTRWK
jgi:ABC-2 type transport system permease protein